MEWGLRSVLDQARLANVVGGQTIENRSPRCQTEDLEDEGSFE